MSVNVEVMKSSPDNIFQVVKSGNRDEIRHALMNPDVKLGMLDPVSGKSLMYELLTQVINGDKLVLEKLDASVGTTNDDPNSSDYAVLIDQKTLVDEDPRSLALMTDLLSLPRDFTQEILDHPVLTTFVKRKWPKLMFFIMTTFYFLFVVAFTLFLLFMFTTKAGVKEDNQNTGIGTEEPGLGPGPIDPDFTDLTEQDDADGTGDGNTADEDGWMAKAFGYSCSANGVNCNEHGLANACNRACLRKGAFYSCRSAEDPLMCASEVIFIISTIILAFQEVWQLMAIKLDYLRELENYFELSIIVLAVITFFWNGDVATQSIIASVCVCLAWIEMIMMTGRLPNDGGLFNIMFYASTKRILKIALGMFFLVLAFGFSFYILHFDLAEDDTTFDKIPKSLASSFSWLVDGADVETLFDASAASKQNREVVEIVAMALVLAMMILGSMILMSLVVSIIIFDFDKLSNVARETSLRNQAHHAVQVRAGIDSVKWIIGCCIRDRPDEESWRQLELIVCVHSVCACPNQKLDQETHDKVMDIINAKSDN